MLCVFPIVPCLVKCPFNYHTQFSTELDFLFFFFHLRQSGYYCNFQLRNRRFLLRIHHAKNLILQDKTISWSLTDHEHSSGIIMSCVRQQPETSHNCTATHHRLLQRVGRRRRLMAKGHA